jgi:hypothetical protein
VRWKSGRYLKPREGERRVRIIFLSVAREVAGAVTSNLRGVVAHGLLAAWSTFAAARALENTGPWRALGVGVLISLAWLPLGTLWEYEIAPTIARRWPWTRWTTDAHWEQAAAFPVGGIVGVVAWGLMWGV